MAGAGAAGRGNGTTGHAIWLISAFALALQWLLVRWTGVHLPPTIEALSSGAGIFGAAFILSWAAELAQLEASLLLGSVRRFHVGARGACG